MNVELNLGKIAEIHGRGRATRAYGASLRYLTAATLAASYLLVVLGDTVRVTESGMGCASWPLCNGSAGLPGGYHALLEQTHRYLAAIVTTLALATFALVWRRARDDRLAYRSAIASVALIGVQVVLGAVTVFAHNAGWTVALHLAAAWLVVATVTITTLAIWRADGQAAADNGLVRPAGRLGTFAATALFLLSVTGMLVLHGGASTACAGWPTCGTGTGSAGAVTLQYLHRSLVLLATIAVIAAAVRAWRSAAAARTDRVFATAALVLLGGTAAVGAVVATTGATEFPQGLHLAVATLFWVSVVALAVPHRPVRHREVQAMSAR